MKILFVAGGSGGHLYPAIELAKFLKKERNAEVYLIRANKKIEDQILEKVKVFDKIYKLEMGGFSKKLGLKNFKHLWMLMFAFNKSKKVLKEIKPDIVFGMGGYVTYPVLKKAKCKKYLHEQNTIPGLANKMLKNRVDKIFISFKESEKYFNKKCYLVKNPRVINLNKENLQEETILIVAGSLGSSTINKAVIKAYPNLKDKKVLFVTGNKHYSDVITKIKETKTFKIVPYLDNFLERLKSAKLIISRSGATTMAEIMELEKISILIPSKNVKNNHQYLNALSLTDKFASVLLEEDQLDLLVAKIDFALDNYSNLKENLKKVLQDNYQDITKFI